jgi:hypothetical protein
MKKTILLSLAALAAIPLAACSTVEERCASAKDPGECVKVANAGGDINDYLLYGMAGYMLANRGGQQVIVQNPSYHGPYRTIPSYASSASRMASKTVTTTTKKSLFGGTKTSTTTTYRSSGFGGSSYRSSYSSGSSFRSSSFRSGGFGRR